MTSKEKIEKAWELVNSKYIETNDEIQLVRYAVRIARDLSGRDIPKKIVNVGAGIDNKDPYYHCGKCGREMPRANKYFLKYCANCGQRLDWSAIK